ncbi:MAG: PEP-CTERM sorting domain-containing protein [Abditibacteriales bacterium]|nr:PEP-CTERM sorting domain-containing protein [Abditibacteriales bacterium]MDW8366352.1 PEP-CTERM sorting domain-containing protein [Abditibacteriales bacterium]
MMPLKRIEIGIGLILLVVTAPFIGRADDFSPEENVTCDAIAHATEGEEQGALTGGIGASITEDELLNLLTAISLQTLAVPFWMRTQEEKEVTSTKDKGERFALLLLLAMFSDVITDDWGRRNLFVGPVQPPHDPGFPPPGSGTPGGGTNSPNFNLPNPFPPPAPPNTPLNNPFGPIPEPSSFLLIVIGLGVLAGYQYRRRKR